jgi:photosystem II stability/assembly factor-like uncharacterized protein
MTPSPNAFRGFVDSRGRHRRYAIIVATVLGMIGIPALPAASGQTRWVRTGGPLGGLGYDIRVHPQDPSTLFVTDAFSGVFKSTDGGAEWAPVNEGIDTRAGGSGDAIPVFCLTLHPSSPQSVWIGTQNARGIFQSANGGTGWTRKDNGIVEEFGITFRGIAIDPNDPDTVYAAAEIASWVWAGEERMGREFDLTRGVVYKSMDGGQNWNAVWRGDNLARYVWIDPRDSAVVYVSTGIFDREAANSDPQARLPGGEGIIKSTDGGQTWTRINNGLNNLYVGSLFMHPEDPDTLLAGAGNIQYREGIGVYLTTDGGRTWEQTLGNNVITSVEFALSDPRLAYAGGADAIYRSADGGRTWVQVSGGENGWGSPGVRAGFPIDFQVDPGDPDRLFVNNYGGGNFLSTDGGRTWSPASKGYTGAQVRDLAVDPTAAGRVFAAARSGIFVTLQGGNEWEGRAWAPAASLEWNAVAIDPADPQHILAANNWNNLILKSKNGGRSWEPASAEAGMNRGWRTIVFAPADSTVVYAGVSGFFSAGVFDNHLDGGGVAVSTDGGATWSAANDATSTTANVSNLAVHPDDAQTMFAATGNRGLLKTIDGGNRWSAKNEGLPNPPVVLVVALQPAAPDLMLVGLESAGVYRSEDGGETWTQSVDGMNPQAMVSDLVFDPTNPQRVYAADRWSGVFRSDDGGRNWTPVHDGLRTREVTALAVSADGAHLYAATEGEGVFRLDLAGSAPSTAQEPDIEPNTPENPGDTSPPDDATSPPPDDAAGPPPDDAAGPPPGDADSDPDVEEASGNGPVGGGGNVPRSCGAGMILLFTWAPLFLALRAARRFHR